MPIAPDAPRAETAPTAPTSEGPARRERLETLVARVGDYVERFESAMEAAVLDENYVQLLRQPCCRESRNPGEDPLLAWEEARTRRPPKGVLARRQLRSEVLLVRIAGGMQVGYRDVYEVEGKTVQDRKERVRKLFLSGTEESALELGRLATESARFNLGRLLRTTNLPTLPLLYLVPAMHPRLHFSRGGEAEVGGKATTILDFREDASPTLAASARGFDMPARGRAWVEPATGAIRRIELRYVAGALHYAPVRRVMNVWFGEDPRIEVLVPTRMWEWYEKIPIGDELPASASQRAWPADLEGLATYSNLRLFSVETSDEVGEPAN
ncbi:MAG: hypothetical protein ABI689_00080 [Thermoanaerobaculia bacterium]